LATHAELLLKQLEVLLLHANGKLTVHPAAVPVVLQVRAVFWALETTSISIGKLSEFRIVAPDSPFRIAVTVYVTNALEVSDVGVPEILPVEVFYETPVGREGDTEYTTLEYPISE